MGHTIYTVSDPASIAYALRAMAMFFGESSWVDGLLRLALIASLLGILVGSVAARRGLRLDVMLISLLVVLGGFIPRTTVTVEQFENNAPPEVVDGVPYAIAIPGAIAGAFSLYVTKKIETVMQGVNGSYIAPSGELDLFTPARNLMLIASAPLEPSRAADPNFQQTLFYAARYCADSALIGAIDFEHEVIGLQKFANSLTQGGITQIYTSDYPYVAGGGTGMAATCSDARTYIQGVVSSLESGNTSVYDGLLKAIANQTGELRYGDAGGAATMDWNDALTDINRALPASAKLNYTAVVNVMHYSLLDGIAKNAKAPIDQAVLLQRDAGLFQWAKDEAAQSILMTSTAPKFMDVLFFIFIAATPIIMFLVLANPATGVKVAGAYVLFGLWTQSWIPMMAIISGWYDSQIGHYVAPGALGLTPAYLAGMMRHVMTTTIAASNMLQASPYIMFALMTGSIFAMTRMMSQVAPTPSRDAVGSGVAGADTVQSPAGRGGAGAGSDSTPLGIQQRAQVRAAQEAILGGKALNTEGGLSGQNVIASGQLAGSLGEYSSRALTAATRSAQIGEAASEEKRLVDSMRSTLTNAARMATSGSHDRSRSRFGQTARGVGADGTTTVGTGHVDSSSDAESTGRTAAAGSQRVMDASAAASFSPMALLRGWGQAAASAGAGVLSDSIGAIEKRVAAGKITEGEAVSEAAGRIAEHDVATGSGFGARLLKGVGLQAKGSLGYQWAVKQGATGSVNRSGDRTDRSSTSNEARTTNFARAESGVRSEDGHRYSETAEQSQQYADAYDRDLAQALTVRQQRQSLEAAAADTSAGSGVQLRGVDIAQAAANRSSLDGGASHNQHEATQRVMSQLAPALGAGYGAFQQQLDSQYRYIEQQAGGSAVANADQVAWAAALKTLQAGTQSADIGERARAHAAVAQAADYGGLGGLLQTGAVMSAAGNMISAVHGGIADSRAAVGAGVDTGVTAAGQALGGAGALQGAVGSAVGRARAGASGGAYNPAAVGQAGAGFANAAVEAGKGAATRYGPGTGLAPAGFRAGNADQSVLPTAGNSSDYLYGEGPPSLAGNSTSGGGAGPGGDGGGGDGAGADNGAPYHVTITGTNETLSAAVKRGEKVAGQFTGKEK